MPTETNPVATWINSLAETFENRSWVKCPSCHEEWTKLHPCNYLNEDMQDVVSYLCVVCAETVAGLPFVQERDQIPGLELQIKHRGAKHHGNTYAILSYGDLQFVASSKGTGTTFEFKEKNSTEMQTAKNVYQLWSKIRREISNPSDTRPEQAENLIRRRGKRDYGYDNQVY